MSILASLGPWNWMILAATLLVLEMLAPGIFLMWFGFAAALTGVLAFSFDISWQWQLIWFCLLSLAAVLVALKYLRQHPFASERPLLNERATQHIGQTSRWSTRSIMGVAACKSATPSGVWKGPICRRARRLR